MESLINLLKDEITIYINSIDITSYILECLQIVISDNNFIFKISTNNKTTLLEYLESFEDLNNDTFQEIISNENLKIKYNYGDNLIYNCPFVKYNQNSTRFSINISKILNLIDKNELIANHLNILNTLDKNQKKIFKIMETTINIEEKFNIKIKLIESKINLNLKKKFKDLNDKCLNLELQTIQLNKENELIKLNNQKQKTYFYRFCLVGLLFIFFNYLDYQSQFPYLSRRKYVHYKTYFPNCLSVY